MKERDKPCDEVAVDGPLRFFFCDTKWMSENVQWIWSKSDRSNLRKSQIDIYTNTWKGQPAMHAHLLCQTSTPIYL